MMLTRRAAAIIALTGNLLLVLMGIAWATFERPAPVLNIAWRAGLSDEARLEAERDLHLERRPSSSDSFEYELWFPGTAAIAAIVAHPDVADTGHVDRANARMDADAGHADQRVWWRGPFRGLRSALEFRLVFALVGMVTLVASRRSSLILQAAGWPAFGNGNRRPGNLRSPETRRKLSIGPADPEEEGSDEVAQL
jgi:hypothetical protein